MKTRFRHFVLLFLGLSMGLTSCKSVKVLPNKAPIKRVDLKTLSNEIVKAQENIKTFRARIKAEYRDGKQIQQVNVNFRLDNKKRLWMSASMLIPIAKLLVTPEEVQFYEKFQKTFYQGDITFINEQLGSDFTFSDLENIFLGNPISDLGKEKIERISHPTDYVLVPKAKGAQFRPTYFFDTQTFRLKEQRFLVAGTAQSLSIKYPQYQKVEGKLVPRRIEISTFDGTNFLQLTLTFLRVDFPSQLTMPFRIPDGYDKIEF